MQTMTKPLLPTGGRSLKLSPYINYAYQPETIAQAEKVPANVVDGQSHRIGYNNAEPLIVMMDSLIRYARAHEKRFGSKLSGDYVLGPEWANAAKAVRALMIGDGAVAHETERSTDSKSNGAVEGMFWDAVKIAGFTEEDLGL
jgi:hypothetical protein